MNGNPLLGQILGGLFGHAMGKRGMGTGGMGGMGGGLGGAALGSVLGGLLGGRRGAPMGGGGGLGGVLGGGRGALLMTILPLAMQWVQRNGGIGEVLKRFQQKGFERQTQSWVSTQDNQAIDERAVEQVVGHDELAQIAQQLGVPEQDVAGAFAEIMPEMVDQLSPEGQLPPEADDVLADGSRELEQQLERFWRQDSTPS